jgi:zinc transport system permease protein
MRVCKNFKSVTICATIIAVFCSFIGILASVVASTPVGSTIVVADLVVFAIFTLISKIMGGKRA